MAVTAKGRQQGYKLMASSLYLSLTDELRAFVDQNSGNEIVYATPSEFVRDLLRKKNRQEAASASDSIIEGYQDAIAGRTVAFKGDLTGLLKKANR
ncbi:MAG: antitoxin ParD1/3/4 [Mariniblastus sp.]|jgi:antitoxin ParD1/3/4